jgi:hypothetical protein
LPSQAGLVENRAQLRVWKHQEPPFTTFCIISKELSYCSHIWYGCRKIKKDSRTQRQKKKNWTGTSWKAVAKFYWKGKKHIGTKK